ncbi:MAG: hypothetical protein AAGI11_15810 [Pseudomonadota bacterium]
MSSWKPLILSFALGALPLSQAHAGNWGENWGTLVWSAAGGGITVPAAPTITSIEPTIGGLTVFFTSGGDGGADITEFTVTCGGVSASGSSSPITVDGLDGNTDVSCSVTATNSQGTSTASASQSAAALAIPRLNLIIIKAAKDAQDAAQQNQ